MIVLLSALLRHHPVARAAGAVSPRATAFVGVAHDAVGVARRRTISTTPVPNQMIGWRFSEQRCRLPKQHRQRRRSISGTATALRYSERHDNADVDVDDDELLFMDDVAKRTAAGPVVQWYPGHIAKAERQLQETLKAVDVVVEVRDARIPAATSHPDVARWSAGKPRVVVLTHVDQVPSRARRAWQSALLPEQPLGDSQEGASETARDSEDRSGLGDDASAAAMDRQAQNQARQALQERLKYADSDGVGNSNRSSSITSIDAVLLANAKTGSGVPALIRAIAKSGAYVQERRTRRGLRPRRIRVGIMGYPNVGKSALINKLLNRKRARSANTPGVTKSLQWIRVKTSDNGSSSSDSGNKRNRGDFDLLDSPGIIPASIEDQSDALLLACCNCIGEAAYDNQGVAAYLCERLISMHRRGTSAGIGDSDDNAENACAADQLAPEWRQMCLERYQFDPLCPDVSDGDDGDDDLPTAATGEDMLFAVAENTCRGNPEDAARKILQDFRTGRMGPICLQATPRQFDAHNIGVASNIDENFDSGVDIAGRRYRVRRAKEAEEEHQQRARIAMETAKERGLELPPAVVEMNNAEETMEDEKSDPDDPSQIGKGLFEGW